MTATADKRNAYDWRRAMNAPHLARRLAEHIESRGAVCQGWRPTEDPDVNPCEHPVTAAVELVPVGIPLDMGGAYYGSTRIVCGFCLRRYLAILEDLPAELARRRGRTVDAECVAGHKLSIVPSKHAPPTTREGR